MASDQRWTGGIANREWTRGSKVIPADVDHATLTAQVRSYLADCDAAAQAGIKLDPKYHPTPRGALMVISHHSAEEKEFICAAFAELTRGQPLTVAAVSPELAERMGEIADAAQEAGDA